MGYIYSVHGLGNGTLVLAGCAHGIRLWNLEKSHIEPFRFPIAKTGQTILAISPNERFALANGGTKGLFLCDLKTGTIKRRLVRDADYKFGIVTASFSPDNKQFLAATHDQTILWWDIESGKVTHQHALRRRIATPAAFSQDGRYLIHCYWGDTKYTISLLDITKNVERVLLPRHTYPIRSIVISRDGRFSLSSSTTFQGKDIIRIWDVRSARLLADFASAEPAKLCFSPDGRYALMGETVINNGEVVLSYWNLFNEVN